MACLASTTNKNYCGRRSSTCTTRDTVAVTRNARMALSVMYARTWKTHIMIAIDKAIWPAGRRLVLAPSLDRGNDMIS